MVSSLSLDPLWRTLSLPFWVSSFLTLTWSRLFYSCSTVKYQHFGWAYLSPAWSLSVAMLRTWRKDSSSSRPGQTVRSLITSGSTSSSSLTVSLPVHFRTMLVSTRFPLTQWTWTSKLFMMSSTTTPYPLLKKVSTSSVCSLRAAVGMNKLEPWVSPKTRFSTRAAQWCGSSRCWRTTKTLIMFMKLLSTRPQKEEVCWPLLVTPLTSVSEFTCPAMIPSLTGLSVVWLCSVLWMIEEGSLKHWYQNVLLSFWCLSKWL